jgi:hypothetical protein
MADHLRKRIRAQVAALLAGTATAGANVFTSRVYAVPEDRMPALLVDTPGELVEMRSIGMDPRLERTLTVSITACVWENDTYNDTADEIARQVEVALAANLTLSGLAKYCTLDRVETELEGEGERPVARLTMSYTALYYTTRSAPDVAL